MSIIEEYVDRVSVLKDAHYEDVTGRLLSILEWLESEPITKGIIDALCRKVNIPALFEGVDAHTRPKASTREEIAAVGLQLIYECKGNGQKRHLFEICMAIGARPPYGGNYLQDYSDSGFKDYVYPFLLYVEKELQKAANSNSVSMIVEHRFEALLSAELKRLLPKTSASFEQINSEFLRPVSDVSWQNIGNSCRQLLLQFAYELREISGAEIPSEVQDSNFKLLLKHILTKIGSSGRYKDTLEALIDSVWNHTQSLLHRSATTKQDALRLFLWTGMLISEVAQVLSVYLEG